MAASARPGRVLMKAAASQLVIALPRERQTATRRSVTSQAAFPGRPPMRQALQRAHSPTALPGSSKGPDAG